MSDAQRVIDEIGALVDEQLQQESSGWDHNLNQPRCRCGVRPGRKVTTDLLESSEVARCFSTRRPLTHSSDSSREGLAMKATQDPYNPQAPYCLCGCGEVTPLSERNHYDRGLKKGEHLRYLPPHRGPDRQGGDPIARVMARVNKVPSGCWIFTGRVSLHGYGVIKVGSRRVDDTRTAFTHRLLYENLHGAVPKGLHLDHLCRNRPCCNPDHLEPVTPRENIHRGVGPAAQNLLKSHCPKGHPYDEGNTRWYQRPPRKGQALGGLGRLCRACDRERDRSTRNRPVTV